MKKSQLKQIIKEEIREISTKDIASWANLPRGGSGGGGMEIIDLIKEKIAKHKPLADEAHDGGYNHNILGYNGGEHDAIVEILEDILNTYKG